MSQATAAVVRVKLLLLPTILVGSSKCLKGLKELAKSVQAKIDLETVTLVSQGVSQGHINDLNLRRSYHSTKAD